jgi:hydrogenase maturation protein HypF
MVRLAQEERRNRSVIQRMHIAIQGAVQGVGFRPFIYRLASEMNLPGWVLNSAQGVFIEVEGETADLNSFLLRIPKEKPAHSFIQSLEYSFLDPLHFNAFEIRKSDTTGSVNTLMLPDIATCDACLSEIFDPQNRRYRYPFTNCTHCGPRFSIIESLPYDRPNTSMKLFTMCPDCRKEYENPNDRRFHAQPNACPVCGPELQLWDPTGKVLAIRDEALLEATQAIRNGKILAIKGLGGFHLMADARNASAVDSLRARKHREEKPFALMYPSMEQIEADCKASPLEARLLRAAESPIVLLERKENRTGAILAASVAPGNPYLGVMLPYTPLHHLLLRELKTPVIATSGNLSDEPICIDEQEALKRLAGIADFFLVHNRPIVRHVDDSILRIVLGRELVLRRARGYAPLPIRLKKSLPHILAVGGHLKNTIAVSVDNNIFLSQHIGDLENQESLQAFHQVIDSFRNIYDHHPTQIAADFHPDYLSTKFARESGLPILSIQHHYAHVAACMAENEIEGPVLGISWDGTGYGLDGTVWGGEFLLTDASGFQRIATFRKFRLPGSAPAVKEPRRVALGILFEMMGNRAFERKDLPTIQAFSSSEIPVLSQMLTKGINAPWTSSAGRLFDAVASLSGLRQQMRFEGQAAMELEFAASTSETREEYPFQLAAHHEITLIDWEPMVNAILQDAQDAIPLASIAKKFHNTLGSIMVAIAQRAGEKSVVLTGGCFQNRILLESAVEKLNAAGFRTYWHQRIPPNDGGIALGQIVAASHLLTGALQNQQS